MDKDKLKKSLQEISNSMTRIEGERDYIRESIKAMSDEHQMDKRVLRKIATAWHKQNYNDETAHFAEFQEVYEELFQ
jgi:hypothetical protein